MSALLLAKAVKQNRSVPDLQKKASLQVSPTNPLFVSAEDLAVSPVPIARVVVVELDEDVVKIGRARGQYGSKICVRIWA
jgi:hypothetical protein